MFHQAAKLRSTPTAEEMLRNRALYNRIPEGEEAS